MGDPTYEMFWDCGFCGTTRLLGKTHRHCPGCGWSLDLNDQAPTSEIRFDQFEAETPEEGTGRPVAWSLDGVIRTWIDDSNITATVETDLELTYSDLFHFQGQLRSTESLDDEHNRSFGPDSSVTIEGVGEFSVSGALHGEVVLAGDDIIRLDVAHATEFCVDYVFNDQLCQACIH
jgi:hypothetical protein